MQHSGKIFYVIYANPAAFPPLEYSSRILADKGWQVQFLGVHSDGPQTLEFPAHPRIGSTVLPFTPPGWRQKVAYGLFLLRARRITREWRPDWLYVSDCLAAPAGLLAPPSNRGGLIYHEHDFPTSWEKGSWFIRQALRARRAIARRAAFVVIPQAERIAPFVEQTETSRPVLRVWNCPLKAEAMAPAWRQRKPDEPLAVYYHGSINLDRVPLELVRGAALCKFPIRIRVVGYETIGSRGAGEQLRAVARTEAPQVAIEFVGPTRLRTQLRGQMDGMHVGWMNFINRSEDLSLRHLAGASNKAFDYLAGGLPIIVPDSPEWRAFYVDPGFARACDPTNSQDIAATLRWFYENPVAAANMGEGGRQRVVTDWNYEAQFESVLKLLSPPDTNPSGPNPN